MPNSSTKPAIQLLEEYIKHPSLKRHSRMVAEALRSYAQTLGEDEALWYQTGLLHDLDWEMFPDEHPHRALKELLAGYPPTMLEAIAAHAPERTGQQPVTLLAKHLFACDEISGFMQAVSLMRPSGFTDMKVKSITKKLKDKSFAANVNRADIERGLVLIDKTAQEHFSLLIDVFKQLNN